MNAEPESARKLPFPFTWNFPHTASYVTIRETTKEERSKNYHSCSLCGEKGPVEFVKVINDQRRFICKRCAEKYVRNAMNFREKWSGK